VSRLLAEFSGGALYVDTVLLVGFVDAASQWHAAGRARFERSIAPVGPIRLVTAALTVDEPVFVLLQELVARAPYGITRSRSQYLAAHPDVVRHLMTALDPVVDGVLGLVALEPVLPEDVAAMRQEMASSGMLPRDAIHVAVMRRLGLAAIASDDDGFERAAGVTLYKP
jgi:predicted nucleic acid-binding protein